jgi:hypothetical protein
MVLQRVLLGLEQPGWALGVAAQAKGRALLYHLTAGSLGLSNEDHASMIATDGSYEAVCEAWWGEVQQDAQAEGDAGAERIVEYSFLFDDRLAIWVLTGTGKLLGSTTVSARVGEAADEDDDQDDEDESDSESEDEKPAKKKPAKKAPAKKPAKKPAAKKAKVSWVWHMCGALPVPMPFHAPARLRLRDLPQCFPSRCSS